MGLPLILSEVEGPAGLPVAPLIPFASLRAGSELVEGSPSRPRQPLSKSDPLAYTDSAMRR